MSKWNGKRFSIYTSDEETVLGVINELAQENNQVTKEIDVINEVLEEKTDLYGDHKGTWQGLNIPTMSEEGMRATVEDIIDNEIPSILSSLDKNASRIEEVAKTGTTMEVVQNKISEMAQNGEITFDTVTPQMTTFIDTINIFNYENASVVNLMRNASTGKVYERSSIQSLIIKVKPNSKYNFSAIGINSQHIYTTKNFPQVGEVVIRDILFDASKTLEGRYYTDIQTASNENYLLVYFYKDSTADTLEIRKTMQLSEGLGLKDFTNYYDGGILNKNIKIPNNISELNTNILANKQ